MPQIWAKECGRIQEILEYERQGKKFMVYENVYLNINSNLRVAKQIRDIIRSNAGGIVHLGSRDLISHKELYETIINKLCLSTGKLLEKVESGIEIQYFDVSTKRDKYKFHIAEVLTDIF